MSPTYSWAPIRNENLIRFRFGFYYLNKISQISFRPLYSPHLRKNLYFLYAGIHCGIFVSATWYPHRRLNYLPFHNRILFWVQMDFNRICFTIKKICTFWWESRQNFTLIIINCFYSRNLQNWNINKKNNRPPAYCELKNRTLNK